MYSKFECCGYLNLWVFKICECSKFIYTQTLRDLTLSVLKKLWISKSGALSFVGTQNLWVHKICDDIKFQVGGREN